MKFYISKPKLHKRNDQLVDGIKRIYPNAEIVTQLEDADYIVFQKGWMESSFCMDEYFTAKKRGISCLEDYLFIDKYKAHLN